MYSKFVIFIPPWIYFTLANFMQISLSYSNRQLFKNFVCSKWFFVPIADFTLFENTQHYKRNGDFFGQRGADDLWLAFVSVRNAKIWFYLMIKLPGFFGW